MKRFNLKLFVGFIAVIIILGGLAASVAAQSSSSTNPPAATASPAATPAAGTKKAEAGKYYQLYQQKLAAALGTTSDKLAAAQDSAYKDTLAQAVKDGKLTIAQADKLTAARTKAQSGGFLAMRHEGRKQADKARAELRKVSTQAVADKLGLSTDQLKAELKAGKSLLDVAKEKNVSESDLRAAIVNAVKTRLDQAVTNGKLTTAQESKVLDRLNKLDLSKVGGHHQH